MRVFTHLSIMIFVLLPVQGVAVDGVLEWGEVSPAHWEIDYFTGDDEAHSIILFDFGETYFNRNMEVVHVRHKRVKILDPQDSDYTEISIPIYTERRAQQIRRVRAQTLNQNSDGTIRSEPVGRHEIYTESNGSYEITRFAFPDVQPGSIIEYTYSILSQNPIMLNAWNFQHDSPILHSEYRVLIP